MDTLYNLINHESYTNIFIWGFIYFMCVYVSVSIFFEVIIRIVVKLKLASYIKTYNTSFKEYRFQITYSIITLVIFAAVAVLFCYLVREDLLKVDFTFDVLMIIEHSFLLLFFSALHFLIIHRILHTKWLYKKIHITHHKVIIPTVWSTYTLHPVESLLHSSFFPLSLLIIDFNAMAFVVLPILNEGLNSFAHSNIKFKVRFGIPQFFRFHINHFVHHNPKT